MVKIIKIDLNYKDAELFKEFCRYEHIWKQAKELKPGSITIHFDNNNVIKKYELHLYRGSKIKVNLNK